MYEKLKIIHWPDPRLKKHSAPVEHFDDSLQKLVERMLLLMREDRGVGLAAAQVGINRRLFVMNPTGKPEDDAAYINPVLSDPQGEQEDEEGCLSLPGINIPVLRAMKLTISAQDAEGKPLQQTAEGFVPRIWQHEFDHLVGTLLTDRMGTIDKLAYRKKLRELEANYHRAAQPQIPQAIRL